MSTTEFQTIDWKDVAREIERGAKLCPTIDAIYIAGADWRARLDAIRRYYAAVQPDIDAVEPCTWAFDVYEVDWPRLFSPIEFALWQDIRALGMVVYPQFPIRAGGRLFFADFANPKARVCIECDGREFHDRQRDAGRDQVLQRHGWTVHRFTGTQCYDDEDDDGRPGETWRRMRAIRDAHIGELSRPPRKS